MAVTEQLLLGLGYAPTSVVRGLTRLSDRAPEAAVASVAEEVPIALVYNGRPYVVVMGTPADLDDLARGFSLTEGIVDDLRGIEAIEVVRASHGIEIQIGIAADAAERLAERSRAMVARTGCGLCGVETIKDAMRVPLPVGASLRIRHQALTLAASELSLQQTLNNETNAVHAAAWASADGTVTLVREDVGRHNALDKLLGAMAARRLPTDDGFALVTSRASYEMVQKAAACGVELLAAISRPTGLAIRFAEAAHVTLVGLVRGNTANVYCGAERITQ